MKKLLKTVSLVEPVKMTELCGIMGGTDRRKEDGTRGRNHEGQ